MERHELTVTVEAAGCRLDKGLALLTPELSRSQIQTLAEKGSILKNGAAAGKKDTLREGDSIIITLPDPVPTGTQAENIPLEIVYEDDDLLVVNKPKGMVVHPAAGNYTGTLVNALLYHCGDSLSGINGEIRPGIVHRIDKDTSGLLIVAKNDTAHRHLAEQIKAHSFTREYEAIVYGHFKERQFTVDAPIGRHKTDRKKMCVTEENSRHAVTHVQVLAEYPGFSHIRCRLECIWPIWATRWWGIRYTPQDGRTAGCMASACTPKRSDSSTQERANIWNLIQRCRSTLRHC